MIRRLQGLGALLALLLLAVGLPWALAATIGNPLLHWSSIKSGDMSDTNVIAILAAVAWVAWTTFALALLSELAASLIAATTRRPRPTIRIPALGMQQELARTLITAVLLLVPVALTTVGPTAAAAFADSPTPASAPRVVAASAAATPPAAVPAPEATTAGNTRTALYRIPDDGGGLRSYWALAEHYLGDGQRWTEIWDLNNGRIQADGSVMDSPQMLHRGWTVLIPAHAQAQHPDTVLEVVEGDTLSQIAETHDVAETAVWDSNEGRVMSDGRTFDDPDLIKPGDTILLPQTSATTTPTHPTPVSGAAGINPQPGPPSADHRAQADLHTAAQPPAETTQLPTPASPRPDVSVTPAAAPTPSADAPATHGMDAPVMAFAGGGGLLLAGVSLTALVRYRRRQFRRRHPGRTVSMTPPELIRMERAVLGAGYVGTADVAWLDQALRSLVHAAATTPGAVLPDVIAVRMTAEELQLVLTGPAGLAPAPWQADASQTRWSVRRGDTLPYTEQGRASYFAPFPTLASVGYTADGEHWLLDLERIAALSLSGDGERCLNLARFLAAELAHNTWSEMLQVTLVGFGQELVAANPDRLNYTTDLASALAEVSHKLDTASAGLASLNTDVLAGRLHDIVGDLWAPHVLLIAPQLAQDRAALDRLLIRLQEQSARTTVALVLADDPDRADASRWHMSVDAMGKLTIPALGVELTAQQIPAEEAAQLAQMLALAALSEDEPIPAAHGAQPWDQYADAFGGLTLRSPDAATPTDPDDEATHQRWTASDVPVLHLADAAPWRNSVLPLSPQTYLEAAATTEEDLKALAPLVDEEIRSQVEQSDPDLDADLRAWHAESCPRPRITLLGNVAVRAQGSLPGHSPQVAFHTEAVAFLSTRPTSGVLSSTYAQMMWPNDPDVVGKPKVRQSITALRKWLGRNPETEEEFLPSGVHEAGAARYRINSALVDAELFRRLRLRGLSRGTDGVDDLWQALDLVQGKPFGDLPGPRLGSPGGYVWVTDANARLDHEYAAMIVDTAHTLATHHFGAGEPKLAARAAQVALRSGTYEDVPLLDLVRACMALDQQAEAESYVKQILANHDAEVEEDLPPRTAEVLFRLRRHWDERAS